MLLHVHGKPDGSENEKENETIAIFHNEALFVPHTQETLHARDIKGFYVLFINIHC